MTEGHALFIAADDARRDPARLARFHELFTPEEALRLWREHDDMKRDHDLLRQALAYEAGVVQAHYEGYKSFPKSRRKIAEEQVSRMRQVAEKLKVPDPFWDRYRRQKLPETKRD